MKSSGNTTAAADRQNISVESMTIYSFIGKQKNIILT